MAKVSIALTWPIRWNRIANGEKIIEQTGLDEIDAAVREGESWIEALVRLVAEAEREMLKSRRENADPRMRTQTPTTSKGVGQKTTARRTGAVA